MFIGGNKVKSSEAGVSIKDGFTAFLGGSVFARNQ